MGRRVNEDIRKIQKSHGSYYVYLPIDQVRELDWQDRQRVIVKRQGKKLVIEDWE